MASQQTTNRWSLSSGSLTGFLAGSIFFVLTWALAPVMSAQTYTVLHSFTGGADGAHPYAGLTIDRRGNFYGTAYSGGLQNNYCGDYYDVGCGTVFKLAHVGSGWTLSPIYSFQGRSVNDGSNPQARVVFGPDGALYGTSRTGGVDVDNCFDLVCGGTVFRLAPPATACKSVLCPWTETIMHTFLGGYDGARPGYGDVTFAPHTLNLYGVTINGGGGLCNDSTCGAAYELRPNGDEWDEMLLYHFGDGGAQGFWPSGGLVLDPSGNLYGTTGWLSSVYELFPQTQTAETLHIFDYQNEGDEAIGSVIFDQAGNLYGTTSVGGPNGGGSVFELSRSGSGWTFDLLYAFATNGLQNQYGSTANLAMDAAGNLYGTTYNYGLNNFGNVFKLTRSGSSWTYTSLHDFTGGNDGGNPWGQVILDSAGNIYGTTVYGGTTGNGVVFEITP